MKSSGRRSLLHDDSAQAMVVGALSMFFILPAVALVVNLSQVINRRVAVQQAADAAAYSAALAEANLLSSLAVTNEAMAYSYYGAMRQAVQVIVMGVLAEFEGRGAPADVVGIPHAGAHYARAYQQARVWVPRGERWMRRLGEMGRAMAFAAPQLMMEKAAEAARESGAAAVAIFPWPDFTPDEGYRLVYYIEQLKKGWRITNDGGYLLELKEVDDRKWEITESGSGTFTFEQVAKDHWRITRGHYEANLFTDGLTYMKAEMADLPVGSGPTRIKAHKLFGDAWEFELKSPGFSLHVLPYKDGTFLIEVASASTRYREHVRWDARNRIQVERGGNWEYLEDQEASIDIGGEKINVSYVRRLTFPDGEFWPPAFIRFHQLTFLPPRHLSLPGVTIRIDPGMLTLIGRHRHVRYRINTRATFDINGLTLNDADGKWRLLDRRRRHRIIEDSDEHWTYEMVREASPLLQESPLRIGYHAVLDNDLQARESVPPSLPPWTRWFRIDAGEARSPESYYQTRACWNPDCDHRPGSESSAVCRICAGRDHDGNGTTDVRVFQYETRYRHTPAYQKVNILDLPAPLKISQSFWKFGIHVGAWAPGPHPLLGQPQGDKSWFPYFRRSPTGLFGTASARVGFLYKQPGPSGKETRRMLYHFDDPQKALQWSQTGFQCLYEPVWSAKLVPMSEAIRSADIGAMAADSGMAFLFRAFKSVPWREVLDPKEFGRGYAPERRDVRAAFRHFPNRSGSSLNTDAPELRTVLQH